MQAISTLRQHTGGLKAYARVQRIRLPFVALAVGAGLVAAHGFLGIAILRQSRSLDTLTAARTTALTAIGANQQTLSRALSPTLTEAEQTLAEVQGAFPDQLETTAFLVKLYSLADTNGVAITSIQNRRSKETAIGQHTYVLAPFAISATGPSSSLVSYLRSLENMEGYTLVVKTAGILGNEDEATLAADVEIYTRP